MDREEQQPLKTIQLFNWLILVFMTLFGWYFAGQVFAVSLLLGGLIATISFWLLKKDLTGLLQGSLQAVKPRFFIKYYIRLAVIGIILFMLVSSERIDIIGLLAGLSVVFLSIMLVTFARARKIFNSREES